MRKKIALVADTRDALNQLTAIVAPLKISIVGAYTQLQTTDWKQRPADLWVVVSENVDDVFNQLSEETDSPILLADIFPDRADKHLYQNWCANLGEKVAEIILPAASKLPSLQRQEYKDIWVIIASVGGPEAIKTFFSHISSNIPVAFIYGQHIDQSAARNLLTIINMNSELHAFYAENGSTLCAGGVAIFPPDQLTRLDERGSLHVSETLAWQMPYTPNLNQIIDNVASHYLYRMGIIVFSGMCDDGAHASIRVAELGAPLWVQNPDECVSASMPESVIKSNLVSYIGDAKSLAKKLNKRYLL